MTSLYRRATPAQRKILRMVEGAVRNACDGHPEIRLPESFPRSVAKRAAGTITSQWGDVLAARSAPSDQGGAKIRSAGPRRSHLAQISERGASDLARRSPLSKVWRELSSRVRPAKEAGQHERVAALIEALKLIAKVQNRAR